MRMLKERLMDERNSARQEKSRLQDEYVSKQHTDVVPVCHHCFSCGLSFVGWHIETIR
jgi:hypothetical protein